LLLLLLHEHLRQVNAFCLLHRYTYGVASFIACSRQLEKNCISYVHSPSTGSIIPYIVVFVTFSLRLFKLVTLNRCSAPLPGNHLFSRMPVQSTHYRQEMTTHHLSPSALSHATYSKYDGGKKTYYLPRVRVSSIYLNLVTVSLLVFNRRVQDTTGDHYGYD
jgi:hypothetical protein